MRLSHSHPRTDEEEGENVIIACMVVIRKVSLKVHKTVMCTCVQFLDLSYKNLPRGMVSEIKKRMQVCTKSDEMYLHREPIQLPPLIVVQLRSNPVCGDASDDH